jgi:hypothetical protein
MTQPPPCGYTTRLVARGRTVQARRDVEWRHREVDDAVHLSAWRASRDAPQSLGAEPRCADLGGGRWVQCIERGDEVGDLLVGELLRHGPVLPR